MSDQRVEVLKRVTLFSSCSSKELAFLASRMDQVEVKPGRVLTRQGQPADSFFALLEGEVEVTVDGRARPPLRRGEFFGEISMLDRGPATATTTARTEASLLVMSHAQFADAIRGSDALLTQVMQTMAARLRRDSLDRVDSTPS